MGSIVCPVCGLADFEVGPQADDGLAAAAVWTTRSCDAASTFRNAGTALISSLTPVRTGHAPYKMPLRKPIGRHPVDRGQEAYGRTTTIYLMIIETFLSGLPANGNK